MVKLKQVNNQDINNINNKDQKFIQVLVKPSSKLDAVSFDKEKNQLVVQVKAPADKNKANLSVIKLLTKHFKRRVLIKSGLTSKEKLIEFID